MENVKIEKNIKMLITLDLELLEAFKGRFWTYGFFDIFRSKTKKTVQIGQKSAKTI